MDPQRKTVLIVDDDVHIRIILKNMLEDSGRYRVVGEGNDAEHALALYKQLQPDLVTMDLMMPNQDGITGIKNIKQYDSRAKIIVVTAMTLQQEISDLAFSLGALDYIEKPFQPEVLLLTIDNLFVEKEIAKYDSIAKFYEKNLKVTVRDKNLDDAIARLDSIVKLYKENPESERYLIELTRIYWEILHGVVNNRVLEYSLAGLTFSETEKLLIDFGWLDDKLLFLSDTAQDDLLKDYILGSLKPSKQESTSYYFSEWLNLQYLDLLKVDQRKELEQKREEKVSLLNRLPKIIKGMQTSRNNLQAASLNAEKLDLLSKQIESNIIKLYCLKRKRDQGKAFVGTERQEFVELQKSMDDWRHERNFLLKDLTKVGDGDRIAGLNTEIEESMKQIIHLKEQIPLVEEEIKQDSTERKSIFDEAEKKEELLSPIISNFESMVRLCAKRNFKLHASVAIDHKNMLQKRHIHQILDTIEELDPKLFLNDRTAFIGKPSFIVIPGIGHGIYDWRINAIILPSMPVTTFEESMIYGLVDYKFRMDEDHEVEIRYYELRPQLKRMGMIKFRQAFTKDYITWITKEGKGVMVFKKEERAWFEKEIAPLSNSLRIPKAFREKLRHKEGIDQLSRAVKNRPTAVADDLNTTMIMGFLHFVNEEKDKAVSCFQKAVKMSPGHLIANYNLALLYEMQARKHDALDQWRAYTHLDKSSWWRNNALKRMNKLR